MKSKLAITSFILTMIGCLPIALGILNVIINISLLDNLFNIIAFPFLIIAPFIFIATLILSIISIIWIRKYDLEGEGLASAALYISLAALVMVGSFISNVSFRGIWS